jgi:uncharacterized protein
VRETLKRYSPKREDVHLGWLNKHLHDPYLWKWNKRTISRAFAIGLFCAFMPIPFHTILAAVLAILFSSNILLSIALVWVNNPITMVPIYYFTYKLGSYIIGMELDPNFIFTMEYILANLTTTTIALCLGGFIVGLIASILGYITILLIYKYRAFKRIKRWR